MLKKIFGIEGSFTGVMSRLADFVLLQRPVAAGFAATGYHRSVHRSSVLCLCQITEKRTRDTGGRI